jgi:glyceraldehyde 3-phosphate dehydrogenase
VEKVIVTCPTQWADATVVYGINQQVYDPWQHHIVSASSCTTNCLAPVAKVLDDAFGVVDGFVTTVHAYTSSQTLLDSTNKDPRRARAGAYNVIPTTTGAAQELKEVLPEVGNRIAAAAVRVPVPTVSLIDLVVRLEEPATPKAVNEAFRQAADRSLRDILAVSDDPLVSSDYVGSPYSAVIDALSTSVVGELIRVIAWYDNEWGYSNRVADLTRFIARQGLSIWRTEDLVPAMLGTELVPVT